MEHEIDEAAGALVANPRGIIPGAVLAVRPIGVPEMQAGRGCAMV